MATATKNGRFQNGCTGILLYNPVWNSGERVSIAFKEASTDNLTWKYEIDFPANTSIPVSDKTYFLFGGQFGGFVEDYDEQSGVMTLDVVAGTWKEVDDFANMVIPYDILYLFDAEGNAQIGYVLITNYTSEIQKKAFGYHNLVYDRNPLYKATLVLPLTATRKQIDQLVNSDTIMFLSSDESPVTEEFDTSDTFVKPRGGGSINPIARKVTITDKELKFSQKAGIHAINCILEG